MNKKSSASQLTIQLTPPQENAPLLNSPSFSAMDSSFKPIQRRPKMETVFQQPTFRKPAAPFQRDRSNSRGSTFSNASRHSRKLTQFGATSSKNLHSFDPNRSFCFGSHKKLINKDRYQQLKQSVEGSAKQSVTGFSQLSVSRQLPPSEYYLYWKNKAHEYLEANMRLMEQTRQLKKENEDLRRRLQEQQTERQKQQCSNIGRLWSEEDMREEVRKVSAIYVEKIGLLEEEIRRKEVVIGSYQLRLGELGRRVSGDQDRMRLMEQMQVDLDFYRLRLEQNQSVVLGQAVTSRKAIHMSSLSTQFVSEFLPPS